MAKARKEVVLTQLRSTIGRSAAQKATLRALGLRHRHHRIKKTLTPAVAGMVRQVAHLIDCQEL